MSQPRKPGTPGGQGNQAGQGGQKRPASQANRTGTGSRPPGPGAPRTSGGPRAGSPNVVRQPIGRSGSGRPSQSRVEQALPPFSRQRYLVIWLAVLVPLIFILLALIWFNTRGNTPSSTTSSTGAGTPAAGSSSAAGAPSGSCDSALNGAAAGKYFVVDTVKGCIVAKLYTDASAGVSKTIANFEDKAGKGYFNGLTFHRVEDWVIQGGDPLGNGTGGGQMPSEYNQLPFKRGALGVARGGDPKINNDSQFFIVKSDADYLDGQYTNWGQVTSGMDVVDKIAIGDKINKITVVNK